jgi:arylsulfatase A-like enzyme
VGRRHDLGAASHSGGSAGDFTVAAGGPNVVAKAQKGYAAGGKTFKVHLDGDNLLPFFTGEVQESPRQSFLHWNDDGQLCAVRVQHTKIVFLEQRATGLGVWRETFTPLRIPKTFNLRSDPFERGDEGIFPLETMKAFFMVPAQAVVAQWLESFKEFPIRQRPASFNLDEVMRKLSPTQ